MGHLITLNGGLKGIVMPNGLRYNGGAVIALSEDEYSMLSAGFKSSYVALDTSDSGFVKQAALSGTAGYALVNGTGNILTWSVPNDGQLHRFQVFATTDVTVAETGGKIQVGFTMPDGTVGYAELISGGGQTVGYDYSFYTFPTEVKAGTTVHIDQTSALTAGTATVWPEIWGS